MVIGFRRGIRTSVALLALVASCGGKHPDDAEGATAVSNAARAGDAQVASVPGRVEDGKTDLAGTTLPASVDARRTLTALRARPEADDVLPLGLADGFRDLGDGLRPHFAPAAAPPRATVTLPKRATSPVRIVDLASGASIDVTIKGAREADAETADGYVVYRDAHGPGATLLHRALPEGVEDFVSFDERPRAAAISYELTLGNGVAGLRLVERTLEMLDAGGAPRLRAAPPYIVGADGVRTDAKLAVAGCNVDRNPAAPWGRKVTAPGAKSCTVRVSWDTSAVEYPAILDPSWTSATGTMVDRRQDHTAIRLANGKVLVVGGRNSSSSTTGLTTASLFEPATQTWGTTNSMSGGRWLHTAVQLGTTGSATTSGKVLVAGGINGVTSLTTAQLYDPTAGTWTPATSMPASSSRHAHTATVLPNGNVVLIGGMNGTGLRNTAVVYNPSSGAGAWTAVTATMSSNRRFHTATLLSSSNSNFNGRVLVAGGNSGNSTSLTTVQLFVPNNTTPASSTWTTTTALTGTAREGHTATTLSNNNVLVTGGKNGSTTLGTALVFTIPASGTGATWVNAGTMNPVRQQHTATLLSTSVLGNGQVLVVGGFDGTNPLTSALLWTSPSTWTTTTALPTGVRGHTATLLANGKVLIAGGIGSPALDTGRIYDPSLGIACTTGTQCASGFCANGVCCDTACADQCKACNLTGLVGTCSNKPGNPPCTDGTACTTGETCQANGTCGGGTTVTCTTANPCKTAGTCNPASGCPTPVDVTDGTTCVDTDACTSGTTCTAGNCTGGTTVTCPADECHAAGTCNPATGCPTPAPAPNGTVCDDHNACTTNDACSEGICQGGASFTCQSPDFCQNDGTCDSNRPLPTPPSTEDLLGWWKLEGNGEDATPGGHHLTNDGAVPEPGRSGMAMRFDGTSCMTTPIWEEARLQGASGVTIMAWINPDVYVCDQQFDMNTVAGRGWDYSIGAWCYEGASPSYGQGVAGAIRVANPVGWGYGGGHGSGLGWHHLAFTWDHESGVGYTFLDGRGVVAWPFPGEISDYDPFAVGCLVSTYWGYDDVMNHFHGAVDEVMLYGRALTPQEIASYYAAADPCTHESLPDNTACHDGNFCTLADRCQSGTCVATSPPITCTPFDACHEAPPCISWVGCHPHTPAPAKPDGTACNDSDPNTDVDFCSAASCVGTADPAVVLGFEAPGRWSVNPGGPGTIVGLDANHTQGNTSLEVTPQNSVSFTSVRMGSLGTVGPLALLDILLPAQQANPTFFGSVQLFVNAPSVGINNAALGQVDLGGLPLATWQTLAFRLTDDQVTRLSGAYTDLTVTITLNVSSNQTGQYLFDNVRFRADIFPTLQGIAKNSANVTKAIFTYATTSSSTSVIYGRLANALSNEDGFIHSPIEMPPQQFVAAPHPAFVATLAGAPNTTLADALLTWKIGSQSATATHNSTPLQTVTNPDGSKDAVLPDGTRVPLDGVPDLSLIGAIQPSDTSYTPFDQTQRPVVGR